MKTIDEDLAEEASACDARFDALQPQIIAAFLARGVTDADMPECLAYAHAEYWRERCAVLEKLRVALTRLERL